MCGLFPLDQVDDIALRRIRIAILKDKDFIDAVLLQCGESHKKANWARQRLADD